MASLTGLDTVSKIVQPPPTPLSRLARVGTLRTLHRLDLQPESELDDLTKLAALVCGTPVAFMRMSDQQREWFSAGADLTLRKTSADTALSDRPIRKGTILEVSDTRKDPRFREHDLVTCAPFVRFYAGVPIETSDGRNIGTLCVIDTVPRQLSVLQRDCLHLLASNAVRTLELRQTGQALGQALLAEQDARDSKAWLSAYVAHESRNMLTVLGTMLDLLAMSQLSVSQSSTLTAAQSSAETLGGLMRDVLDLTRSESRSLSIAQVSFDLRPLLERISAQYHSAIGGGAIRVEVELDDALPRMVTGDPKRLEQVLHNLLGNAAKFTREGEVTLSASVEQSNRTGQVLRFEVRDQGVGMSQPVVSALFEAYRPGPGHEKAGTGLGLYIARLLVEQMGGIIGARSQEGVGSTFHFVLHFPHDTRAF